MEIVGVCTCVDDACSTWRCPQTAVTLCPEYPGPCGPLVVLNDGSTVQRDCCYLVGSERTRSPPVRWQGVARRALGAQLSLAS